MLGEREAARLSALDIEHLSMDSSFVILHSSFSRLLLYTKLNTLSAGQLLLFKEA